MQGRLFILLRDFYIKETRIKMYINSGKVSSTHEMTTAAAWLRCSQTSVAVMCRVVLVLEHRSKEEIHGDFY